MLDYRSNEPENGGFRDSQGSITMPIESKITSQGQVSVPAPIRKKLGLAPGSVLEWCEQGDRVIVRRAARYTFEDIHAALFPTTPEAHSLVEFDEGIRNRMRHKHARH